MIISTKEDIVDTILSEYRRRYNQDWEPRVEEVVQETFGGHLGVVGGCTDSGDRIDEICFVSPTGAVRIFDSTGELAYFLESKARASWLERFFYRETFTGFIFVFLLIAIVAIGLARDEFAPQILTILISLIGAVAGYFFGSAKGAK